jgi:hypothetical protein
LFQANNSASVRICRATLGALAERAFPRHLERTMRTKISIYGDDDDGAGSFIRRARMSSRGILLATLLTLAALAFVAAAFGSGASETASVGAGHFSTVRPN